MSPGNMNRDMTRARTFALWLLRHAGPLDNREVIIGDLLEQWKGRKSARWFWREVFSALVAGRRMPLMDVGLALLGPVLPIMSGRPLLPISLWRLPNPFLDGDLSWALNLGWPLYAILDCGLRLATLTLLVMIELMVVFAFQRALSWANVGRAGLIVFPVLSVGLLLSLELEGHLSRHIENAVDQIPFFCAMLAALSSSRGGKLVMPEVTEMR